MPRTNKSGYNEYMREYNRARWRTRRVALIEMLGGKCVRCESADDLEFDHVAPSSKSFHLASRPLTSWPKLVAEANKCQLLCSACHRDKTRAEASLRVTAEHGSVTMYMNHGCRCEACKVAVSDYRRCSKQLVAVE